MFKGRWKGAVVAVKVVEHSAFGTDVDIAATEERRAARCVAFTVGSVIQCRPACTSCGFSPCQGTMLRSAMCRSQRLCARNPSPHAPRRKQACLSCSQ